jgi:hypothetical protein
MSGNEVDPKVKPAPSVTIHLLEDAEDLEPPDDMLHRQSDLGQLTIVSPLGVGQRVKLAGLLRRPGVGMLVLNALIPSIREQFGVGVDGRLRLPQESKIMRRPTTRGHAEDLMRDRMDQELQFQGVALLFPAVPVSLPSWAEHHPYGACPLFWGVHRAPRSRPPRPQ